MADKYMRKLELGQTVMTHGIANFIEENNLFEELGKIVVRHANGDWGDVPAEDKRSNDRAFKNGDDRILSSYKLGGEKVWVITEWDRSVTTVLFPSEY